jgi:hypothetical protein
VASAGDLAARVRAQRCSPGCAADDIWRIANFTVPGEACAINGKNFRAIIDAIGTHVLRE